MELVARGWFVSFRKTFVLRNMMLVLCKRPKGFEVDSINCFLN